MEFNQPARELPSFDYSLLNIEPIKKYQRVIFGPSSYDSVPISVHFTELFLSHPKEWIFDQNEINIRENSRSNTAL